MKSKIIMVYIRLIFFFQTLEKSTTKALKVSASQSTSNCMNLVSITILTAYYSFKLREKYG